MIFKVSLKIINKTIKNTLKSIQIRKNALNLYIYTKAW